MTHRARQAAALLLAVCIFFTVGVAPARAQPALNKSLNTREFDLTSVIEYISRRFDKVIIPDQNLLETMKNKKAVIVMPPDYEEREQTAELWRQIFENILTIYGYTVVEKGDVYRLVPLPNAKKLALPLYKDLEGRKLDSEKIVTAVVRLKHVKIDTVRPFFAKVSDILPPIPLPDNTTMIVTAMESELAPFLELISLVDIPSDIPYVKVYKLERASGSQVRGQIQAYINLEKARQKGAADITTMPFILADDRTNRMLISAIKSDHVIVDEIIGFMDAEVEKNDFRPITIYRLKNSNSKIVAEKLGLILKARNVPGVAGAPPPEDIPTIVPFEELNALIISVEERETFDSVRAIIELLDVKRNQVFISSTIVEVGHSRNANVGVELGAVLDPQKGKAGFLGGSTFGLSTPTLDLTATPPVTTRTPNIPSNGAFFAIPISRFDAIPFILQAAEQSNKINVLATPVIICDDNEKALIEINEERAFTTTQVSSGGVSTSSFGGFNKAGIILTITPTISSNNFLKLVIDQSVDRFIPDPSGQNRDTKSTRHASTTVTIPNRTSVVVGGLTQSQESESSNRVPLLSKIPLLGALFRSKGNEESQSTLYFFITPEIIEAFEQMSDLSEGYRNRVLADKDFLLEGAMNKELRFMRATTEAGGWRDQREVEYFGVLERVFSVESLQSWVLPEKRSAFREQLLSLGAVTPVLLPDGMRANFDEKSLPQSFFDTLVFAHEQMEAWSDAERISLVARFYAHLAKSLKELDSRRQTESGKNKVHQIPLKVPLKDTTSP